MHTTVTIASGASQSSVVDLEQDLVCGIELPGTWTTADITFLVASTADVSADGVGASTYLPLYDQSGTEVVATAAASRMVALVPANFAGFRYLKLRSGTAGTPVNQAGDRTLKVITRPA